MIEKEKEILKKYQREKDEVMLTHLKYIREATTEIKADIGLIKEENKSQWGKINLHETKIAVLESKANGGSEKKNSGDKGFEYSNLKYIVIAALFFIGGIVAIIMKYTK